MRQSKAGNPENVGDPPLCLKKMRKTGTTIFRHWIWLDFRKTDVCTNSLL